MTGIEPLPIAVIGIGCRLPGRSDCPDAFWQMLIEGCDAWSDVPEDRFNWKSFYNSSPAAQGCMNHRGGHFIRQDVKTFDADFFGIPPTEADSIDPQQRLLLETTYEAIEDAGLSLEDFRGSNTAVYAATFANDYDRMLSKDPSDLHPYHLVGMGNATFANRISYVFDLGGPSVTIDTGCSGSLVAVHQACQSLRTFDSDLAIGCGAVLMLCPDHMVAMSPQHILNEDGRCFSFDSRGSGYGRGEGAGIVLLKRLDEAIRDGDPIRAVIKNTASNQDGHTNGIAQPSQAAQERLALKAFRNLDFAPEDIHYLEAHATGTLAGDIAEISAIRNVYTSSRAPTCSSLIVGSVKSNIGHLEAASGVAGLIKTILCMEKGMIPPNLLYKEPKAGIDLVDWRMKIPLKLEPWPLPTAPRRAVVNNFGYGGTNALVVLESAAANFHAHSQISPTTKTSENADIDCDLKPNLQLLQFSAKSEASLIGFMADLRDWLRSNPETDLGVIADHLSHRTNFSRRKAIVADTATNAIKALGAPSSIMPSRRKCQTIFVFTGQGAQWPQMGRELMHYTTFSNSIHTSDLILKRIGSTWSLKEELVAGAGLSRMNDSEIAQPATTALQIALIDLLRSWHILPYAVIGHSSGEMAAAYSAQMLSHEDAITVAFHRGSLAKLAKKKLKTSGAMAAVGLGDLYLHQRITSLGLEAEVSVACINSPSSTTASGSEEGIDELERTLTTEGKFVRRLKINTAYHSRHMEAVADDYLGMIRDVIPGVPSNGARLYSTVTTQRTTSQLSPTYWVQNLVSPVRFSATIQAILRDLDEAEHVNFVEIGPHSALQSPLRQIMSGSVRSWSYVPTLIRNQDGIRTILGSAATLFENGLDLKVRVPSKTGRQRLAGFPHYHWERKYHWHEPRLSTAYRQRIAPPHDLLGLRTLTSPDSEPSWRVILGLDRLPWLADHVIDGVATYPATAYLSMATEAYKEWKLRSNGLTKNINFQRTSFTRALQLPESPSTIELVLNLRMSTNGWATFRMCSISEGTWYDHCSGEVQFADEKCLDDDDEENDDQIKMSSNETSLDTLSDLCQENIEPWVFYDFLKRQGNEYGPTFSSIRRIQVTSNKALVTITIPDLSSFASLGSTSHYTLHPAIFDAMLQIPVFLFAQSQGAHSAMPVSFNQVSIASNIRTVAGSEILVSCTLYNITARTCTFDITGYQTNGLEKSVPVVQCLRCNLVATGDAKDGVPKGTPVFEMVWDTEMSCITSDDIESCERGILLSIESQEDKLNRILNAADFYIQAALREVKEINHTPSKGHLALAHAALRKESREPRKGVNEENTRDLTDLGVEGRLIQRIGPSLGPILRGKTDALTLLLEDDLLYEAYQDDSTTRCNSYLIQYMKHAAFQNPNLRVLEIGAGTGGSTLPLLQALSSSGIPFASSYHFSDISSGFFEQAKASLSKWSNLISWKTLDIERDPTEQGFKEHSYDFIIASNVLHATRDIANTLANVHRLLKPGGRLALTELIENNSFYRMTFGLLPGWWSGINDNRTDGPLLSIDRWTRELRRASFAGPDIVASDFPGIARRAAFMVSTAIATTRQNGYHTYQAKLLSFLNPSESGQTFVYTLAHELEEQSYHLTTVSWSTIGHDQESSYIILESQQHPFFANCTPQQFDCIKRLVTGGATIYWLTLPGDATAPCHAGAGLVTGFARTARSENEALRFITVDICRDATLNLDRISHLVAQVVSTPTSVHPAIDINENEFRIIDGDLQIPRVTRSVALDEVVSKKVVAKPHTQGSIDMPGHLARDATYIVVGGLGKLGRQMCEHLASLGARSVALLTRKVLNVSERSTLESQMSKENTSVRILTCDVSKSEDIKHAQATIHMELPPVKGVIQAAMVLEDRSLNDMTLDSFTTAITPKYAGTSCLYKSFESTELDFFIMLSSLSGIVGLPGQANYAAGNTFEDHLAHHDPPESWKRLISLDLPLLADTNLLSEEDQPKLMRRGMQAISNEVLFPYLEYAMGIYGPESVMNAPPRNQQIVLGLDMQAASEGNQVFYAKNPLFAHVFASQTNENGQATTNENTTAKSAIVKLVSGQFGPEDRHSLTVQALREKIASLVAVSYDEIGIESPIVNFGLDSLIAIELKNWITKTLKAPTQTSDILDSKGILALTDLVLKRSGYDTTIPTNKSATLNIQHSRPPVQSTRIDSAHLLEPLLDVPKLPLRPLNDILDSFYDSVVALGNEEELFSMRKAMHNFRTPGGVGEDLQRRLVNLANDPTVDCWLSEIYNQSFWLRRRAPLRPSINFFSSHVLGPHRYTQAEKAALLTLTAFEFKLRLESGRAPQDFVNDEPQCMESLKWIFNIYRRPGIRCDETLQFPGNDYIAVMHNGHVYKVSLIEKAATISHSRLVAIFDAIKRNAPKDISWAGLLTAAERTEWAKARELAIDVSTSNQELFTMIEKALFIISLDDTRPETSQERARSFLFDDNRNRWNDKTLSFVVCENGASAFWCEHSMIDGTTMDQLASAITRAINGPKPDVHHDTENLVNDRDFTLFPFITSPEVDEQIELVRAEYQDSIKQTDFAVIDLLDFGENYLRQHRLPPKGVLNAIISLAVRKHFGHSPAFYEAVSMRSFRLGRLEIYQIHTPEMATLIESIVDSSITSVPVQQYKMLQDAANAHASGIANHSRGRGWDRQLTALRCVLEEGEEEPDLFKEALYTNTRPRKVFVSFSSGGQPEWDSVWRDEEALWIGVEIAKNSCKLCISNGEGKANTFGALVEEAAGIVRAIIEGSKK